MHSSMDRRRFLSTLGLAGAGAAVAPALMPGSGRAAGMEALAGNVPTRPFGKTGIEVPILALGGSRNFTTEQLILHQALQTGVSYWDTSSYYAGGNSEIGIGMFFERNPELRKDVFLVTKGAGWGGSAKRLNELFEQSLERLKTDYIDLYFIHGTRKNPLIDEVRTWAEQMKRGGRIKLFGFSTHSDMADWLMRASKAGWIDGIMTTYNFRIMDDDDMKRAVEACHQAGIGLTAMKTQAKNAKKDEPAGEARDALLERLSAKGYSLEQAKLRMVWEQPAIASICSQMMNLAQLRENAAAAVRGVSLDAADRDLMRRYAMETCSGYCAGCGAICNARTGGEVPVNDIMRCLMYYREYGEPERAREYFGSLSAAARHAVRTADFTEAERACPRHMPIGALMREADALLS